MFQKLYIGDSRTILPKIDEKTNLILTSPPYNVDKDYEAYDDSISYKEHIQLLEDVFKECYGVMKDHSYICVNIGRNTGVNQVAHVAIILEDIGFKYQHKIIWCLESKTELYTKIDGKPWTGMVSDLYNLYMSTDSKIKLPSIDNSESTWTELKSMQDIGLKSGRKITLTNGFDITVTNNHRFPVSRSQGYPNDGFNKLGFKRADEIDTDDLLFINTNFKNDFKKMKELNYYYDDGKILGLYIAEGNKNNYQNNKLYTNSNFDIRITLNKNEENLIDLAKDYGFYETEVHENYLSMTTVNKKLKNMVRLFTRNNKAKNKELDSKIFSMNENFLRGVVAGYIEGDGWYDKEQDRYKIGTTNNYKLRNDFVILSRILGYDIRQFKEKEIINPFGNGNKYKTIGFSLRKEYIRKRFKDVMLQKVKKVQIANNQKFYNIEVENDNSDWSNLFCIANGILSHNSKPEGAANQTFTEGLYPFPRFYEPKLTTEDILVYSKGKINEHRGERREEDKLDEEHLKKFNTNVWKMQPAGQVVKNKEHPAPFPKQLPENCIRFYTRKGDTVLDPFLGSGTSLLSSRELGRNGIGIELNENYIPAIKKRVGWNQQTLNQNVDYEVIFEEEL